MPRLALLFALLPACTRGEDPVVVFAAASLTDALPAVADAWRAQGGAPVVFNFDASSRLAMQIEQGAAADLYLSADERWMARLVEGGRVQGEPVALLGNRLVVVVPDGATAPLSPQALGAAGRVAVADAEVPAGRYARASLEALGLLPALAPRLVSGDNVRTALAWVARGEVDAGLVYATDAAVEPAVKVAFAMPEDSHPPIRYPAALLREAPHPERGAALLAFCQSPQAAAVFTDAGFTALAALR
ncbi:MAG: molybdate ABC transporter substrate-binding protein [Alphaproteobacteria bacterium]|nr:molybdate ABC transporter substrate-binding protein [Alphaproteobacteria bacterium]